MQRLGLGISGRGLRRVLCIGAHCDDIEIGCGGAILRLIRENPEVEIDWVVVSSNDTRAPEARNSAEQFLSGAGAGHIIIKEFRDGFFPYEGVAIKAFFEELKARPTPDVIFTHTLSDRHQDHRLISEMTWNTFRNHLVLEYEVPKYEGDLGATNLLVALEKQDCERKVKIILESFASERGKYWFTAETFQALARLRGIESRADSGYAEGFYARKIVI